MRLVFQQQLVCVDSKGLGIVRKYGEVFPCCLLDSNNMRGGAKVVLLDRDGLQASYIAVGCQRPRGRDCLRNELVRLESYGQTIECYARIFDDHVGFRIHRTLLYDLVELPLSSLEQLTSDLCASIVSCRKR